MIMISSGFAATTLPRAGSFEEIRQKFRWNIPTRYNIATSCCDVWAEAAPDRTAIIHAPANGPQSEITYGWLQDRSNRLANTLQAHGILRGDRVAILLPQSPEVAASHLGIYKMGAVALPIATVFGVDAITYRLQNSGARALITNKIGLERIAETRGKLPGVKLILSADGEGDSAVDLDSTLSRASSKFTTVDTAADEPAILVYTSGTTGPPKGALHSHRVLLGNLPSVETHHNLFPQAGDRIWTPADWAWAGGLLTTMLPALHFGVPLVARRFDKFDPEEAYSLLERTGIRNIFIPATALRMLRATPSPVGRYDIRLRTIGSGGETLGVEPYEWGKAAFNVTINEFYGQTECITVLSSCSALGISKPGSLGCALPGHQVAIIDNDGAEVARGETGQIAVARPDPAMFLQYWDSPDATREKFIGKWMTTGDLGTMDHEGYVRFVGRKDDMINSAGFRLFNTAPRRRNRGRCWKARGASG
jgi:acetyl-CoA synthetase